jgi:hypothetical protein
MGKHDTVGPLGWNLDSDQKEPEQKKHSRQDVFEHSQREVPKKRILAALYLYVRLSE